MTMKKLEGATPAVGPYSAGVAANGLVFVSGQLPAGPDGKFPLGIRAQAEQSIKNVETVLKAGGSDLQHVVKTTVFLRNINDFAAVNEVYAQYFNGETLPARSCIEVSCLPKSAPLEIEAIGVAAD